VLLLFKLFNASFVIVIVNGDVAYLVAAFILFTHTYSMFGLIRNTC